ncbi:DUF4384 domain-containing protein [Arenibaculum pallidiluteum]|uniref:DUF4384 domain-containing protein n=1 Tax=Arenibaculum pallidiluteum TaxID=2812559 RepID=UPI001A9671A3|nr:DUF4384 domain-containing protein [Arenibaculum pallidiluteum]
MRLAPVAALAAALLSAAPSKAEEAIVLATTAPALALGQVVPDGSRLSLPDGASAILLLASGRTVPLRGPFDGDLGSAAAAAAEPSRNRGTTRFSQEDVAASRSLAPGSADASRRVPPMDLTASGRHCTAPGHAPLVARPAAPAFARMTLSDEAGRNRAVLSWTADGDAPWPTKEIPLADGIRVHVAGTDGAARTAVEIRVLDAEAIRTRGLPIALASAGCTQQARVLLAAMRDAVAPVEIYLSTDRGPDPVFRKGEPVRLTARTSRDAKVYCLLRDVRGAILPIFPSPSSAGPLVRADAPLEMPGARMPTALNAEDQDIRCFATDASLPDILPAAAASTPLDGGAQARLDAAFDAIPRGSAATGQVLLRTR